MIFLFRNLNNYNTAGTNGDKTWLGWSSSDTELEERIKQVKFFQRQKYIKINFGNIISS